MGIGSCSIVEVSEVHMIKVGYKSLCLIILYIHISLVN